MKISSLQQKKVLETDVAGVYIRDLPIKEYEERFKDADKKLDEENKDFVIMIFKDIVCDAKGNAFEDLVDVDYEGLSELLSLNTIFEIIHSIPKAIVPAGVDLGNLSETGKAK